MQIVFDCDGDAAHVHQAILEAYPKLKEAGGFEALRTAEKSTSKLVVIPAPRTEGLTVAYLKSVLNQAKCFIRPVQRNMDLNPVTNIEVSMMNMSKVLGFKVCLQCNHS